MNYIELLFDKSLTITQKDLLTFHLGEIGFDAFTDDELGFHAFISEPDFEAQKVNFLLQKLNFPNQFQQNFHPSQNWNAQWEKSYEPIAIDSILRIRAAFHEPDSNYNNEIIIVPKMSFGTGHHDTTRLICKEMYNLDFQNKTVLDMGCGTGILAIYAIKLGAKSALAIDIETNAYENTIENCMLNEISTIHVEKGGIEKIPPTKFNVILANINRNVLLEQIPVYVKHLSNNGILLISGFFANDCVTLIDVCVNTGMKFVLSHASNEWAMLKFEKN